MQALQFITGTCCLVVALVATAKIDYIVRSYRHRIANSNLPWNSLITAGDLAQLALWFTLLALMAVALWLVNTQV